MKNTCVFVGLVAGTIFSGLYGATGEQVSAMSSFVKTKQCLLCASAQNEVSCIKHLCVGVTPATYLNQHTNSTCSDAQRHEKEKATPLILASQKGCYAAVRWLLKHGADVHAEDAKKITALRYAATLGHAGIVEQLLGYGAGEAREGKCSAFQDAIRAGHQAVVQAFLSRRIASDRKARIVLAASFGHQDIVELLWESEWTHNSPEVRRELARDIIMNASRHPHVDVIEGVLRFRDGDDLSVKLDTLLAGLKRGHWAVVELAKREGSYPVHAPLDAQGNTMLMIALMSPDSTKTQKSELAQKLIEEGAQVGVQNEEGDTPFMLACTHGLDLELLEKMVAADRVVLTQRNHAGQNAGDMVDTESSVGQFLERMARTVSSCDEDESGVGEQSLDEESEFAAGGSGGFATPVATTH